MASKILKKKAWQMFALYIKLRDASADGSCECCTCGEVLPFDAKECHAGHFVAGRGGNVLFEGKVTHPQCQKCNMFNSGEQGRYTLFMKRKYGYTDEQIEELLNMRGVPRKWTDTELEELIRTIHEVIIGLLASKFLTNTAIADRVEKKIKTFGVKKLLEAK